MQAMLGRWNWVAIGILMVGIGIMLDWGARGAAIRLSDDVWHQVRTLMVNETYLRDW